MDDDSKPGGSPKSASFQQLKVCMANAVIDHVPDGKGVSSFVPPEGSKLGLGRGAQVFAVEGGVYPKESGQLTKLIDGLVETKGNETRFGFREQIYRGEKDDLPARVASVEIIKHIHDGKVGKVEVTSRDASVDTSTLKSEVSATAKDFEACASSPAAPVLKRPINGFGLKP